MVAERINSIELSPTLKIGAKAKAMKNAGINVVDLSVGEPDFPTPENIKDAAYKAIQSDFTHYTQGDGTPEMKNAVISKLMKENHVTYEPAEIQVSCGAKHSLYNLSLALLDEDDEVIIPVPYWVSYPQQVILAKAKPVFVQTREEDGFKLTPRQLKDNITFKTRAIIINNPCNPTGTAYEARELEELAQIAVTEGLYIIADEIYEKIVYDDFQFVSIASLSDKIKEKTIVINGVSKAYAMTGWRIGYAAGPRDIIAAMSKLQSHNTSNPNSIAQKASIEALIGPQHSIEQMRMEFQKRRNFVMQRLRRIPGISCYEPQGAFYLFPNISNFFDTEYKGMTVRNSFGLAYYLLKEAHLAIVPGTAFGAENYIRLSYASSMDILEDGMDKLENALANLQPSRKARRISLSNVQTNVKGRITVQTDLSESERDSLLNEADYYLPYNHYYEWNANINGIIVQLRTNVTHLYDFWVENWYPAQIESDLEPHGIIYAVDGVPGREPASYYHSASKTGLIFNTTYYGQVKQLALGIVADLAERLFHVHMVRGNCLEYNGQGVLILSLPAVKREKYFHLLMSNPEFALHSQDVVFIRYHHDGALADISERKFYLKTALVTSVPELMPLLERSKCENVVQTTEQCEYAQCPLEQCEIEKGEPYCFFGLKKSRALIDPLWMVGPERYVKRTNVKKVILMTKDLHGPVLSELSEDDFIHLIDPGGGFEGAVEFSSTDQSDHRFLNPYLLVSQQSRLEMQRMLFRQLVKNTRCTLLNIAELDDMQIINRLEDLIKE